MNYMIVLLSRHLPIADFPDTSAQLLSLEEEDEDNLEH